MPNQYEDALVIIAKFSSIKHRIWTSFILMMNSILVAPLLGWLHCEALSSSCHDELIFGAAATLLNLSLCFAELIPCIRLFDKEKRFDVLLDESKIQTRSEKENLTFLIIDMESWCTSRAKLKIRFTTPRPYSIVVYRKFYTGYDELIEALRNNNKASSKEKFKIDLLC